METELNRDIRKAGVFRQYDEHAKKILANKYVLAYILRRTVQELHGMDIEEIVSLLNNDILISSTPVIPQSISSGNLEDEVIGEGKLYYDIRFTLDFVDGKPRILFDVEAQKKYDPGYSLITRGIVYDARMISGQMDREFTVQDYDGLKKVYSIWVCFNAPNYIGNCITKFSMQPEHILGDMPFEPEEYDKLSVIMICLNRKTFNYSDETIKLLNLLFPSAKEELNPDLVTILENDYHFPKASNLAEEANTMCNLSEGIYEKGIEEGISKIVQSGLRKGLTCEFIADKFDIPIETVKQIAEEMSCTM